ncbi:MAG: hypothetical protein KDK36_09635 [Leptospiraceae bacterium]|nr:hypothetical protein [Leptospiraceae bacterium]
MKVSYFEDTFTTVPKDNIDILKILDGIKKGKWSKEIEDIRKIKIKDKQTKLKLNLPNFTASGTFSECKNDSLIEHSGLIQIDIDNLYNDTLRKKLENDEYIFSVFLSPSGTGMKALVKIPAVAHLQSFKALEKYFKNKYNIKIDTACKNLSRRFYVSYDSNLYLNKNSSIFSEIEIPETNYKDLKNDEINPEQFREALSLIPAKTTNDGKRDFYNLIIWATKTVLGEGEARTTAERLLSNSKMKNEIDSIIRTGNKIDYPQLVFREAKNYGFTFNKKSNIVPFKNKNNQPTAEGNTAVKNDPQEEDYKILSDIYNTEIFVSMYGDSFKFCKQLGFLYWNKKFWEDDSELKIKGLARKTAKAITKRLIDKSKNLDMQDMKHIKYTQSKNGIYNMVSLSKIDTEISINEIDKESYLLNLNNGVYDIRTGKLGEHLKEYHFTNLMNIDYKKDATYPKFQKFLNEIFIDENGKTSNELILYVQMILGSCLVPIVKNEHWYFCYGEGNNGKSTLFKIMESILGRYYSSIKSDVLMKKNSTDHRTSIAKLFDSRMVVSSETNDGTSLNESLLKELTGRDLISANFMRKDEFSFYPKFKLFTFGNHKPGIRGTDNGIWRRVKLIPFLANIPKEKIVKDINEIIIKEEKPGVLNWLLQGLSNCIKNGWKIDEPEIVQKATSEYRESQDTIGQFLNDTFWTKGDLEILYNNRMEYLKTSDSKKWKEYEKTLPDNQKTIELRSIIDNEKPSSFNSFWVIIRDKNYYDLKQTFALYENWCEDNSYTTFGKKNFNEKLESKGYKKRNSGGWKFYGLTFKY